MARFQEGERVYIEMSKAYMPGVVLEVFLPRWTGGVTGYTILLDEQERPVDCNEHWLISEAEGRLLTAVKGIA